MASAPRSMKVRSNQPFKCEGQVLNTYKSETSKQMAQNKLAQLTPRFVPRFGFYCSSG